MKYAEEARCGALVKKIIKQIIQEIVPERHYYFLDFCSRRTHSTQLYDLKAYLPENVKLLHASKQANMALSEYCVQNMIGLAKQPGIICCGYPDVLLGHRQQSHDLLMAKAEGADIRVVYNIDEAINLAKTYPARHIVFLATGFEADMLQTAQALQQIKEKQIKNVSIYTDHKTALQSIIGDNSFDVDKCTGFLMPMDFNDANLAHYHTLQLKTKNPVIISGFEPVDILQSLLLLIRQNNANTHILIMQHQQTLFEEEKERNRQLLRETFVSQAADQAEQVTVHEDFQHLIVQFTDQAPMTAVNVNKDNIAERDNIFEVSQFRA